MSFLTSFFSNRELSLILWIIILIVTMSFDNKLRKSMLDVITAFFTLHIIITIAMMAIYIGIVVFLLTSISLWDWSLLKDTALWFLSFAIVTFFNIDNAKKYGFFKSLLAKCFKWTILLEFFINLYSFSLPVEIILLPILAFISLTQAFAQKDKKNEQVTRFLTGLLSIIGAIYFFYALYKTIIGYQNVFTFHTFNALILPILLTISLIPYIYLIALFMQYKVLFIRVDFIANDKEKSRLLKHEIIRTANLNLNKIRIIAKNLNKMDYYHSSNPKQYVKKIMKL